ncbi:MAG: hypothetical protein KA736_05475 [Crocinitomicaceae bacterium]|nr:hypothetical protein [Crocinitomicaceae bacterium]MBP6031964.1 hypothetical protein [Crocinitomicaceae bacterium]
MFEGRSLFIATNHRKESAIQPILERELNVNSFSIPMFNTDQFGTFSGEIERSQSPVDTLKAKCQLGFEVTGCDLVIATEGSFGAHPDLPFCAAHDELILLMDFKNNVSFSARILTTETNFQGKKIKSEEELIAFGESIDFPNQAIILRNEEQSMLYLKKGINDWDELLTAFRVCMRRHDNVFVETDMRAMHNPLRMKHIEQLTLKLITQLKVLCPSCEMPCYGVTSVLPGLPCWICETPTSSVLKHVLTCAACQHQEEVHFPNGRQTEEPTFCPACNP